jgi:CPA2 family monovalent cation:H+ antiporter-2
VGRFGGVVNQVLRAAGFRTVVLDHHSEHLERLRVFGVKVFYGDATRPDLLHAAGIATAKMLVIAIDDRAQATELVRHVATHHPQVYIVARAIDRHHVYELYAAGCRDIIRENFDGAVRAARSALEALGVHPYDAELQVRGYVENDRWRIRELAELYDPDIPAHENAAYVARTKELLASLEDAMRGSGEVFGARSSRGWMPPDRADVDAVIAEHGSDSTK